MSTMSTVQESGEDEPDQIVVKPRKVPIMPLCFLACWLACYPARQPGSQSASQPASFVIPLTRLCFGPPVACTPATLHAPPRCRCTPLASLLQLVSFLTSPCRSSRQATVTSASATGRTTRKQDRPRSSSAVQSAADQASKDQNSLKLDGVGPVVNIFFL